MDTLAVLSKSMCVNSNFYVNKSALCLIFLTITIVMCTQGLYKGKKRGMPPRLSAEKTLAPSSSLSFIKAS